MFFAGEAGVFGQHRRDFPLQEELFLFLEGQSW